VLTPSLELGWESQERHMTDSFRPVRRYLAVSNPGSLRVEDQEHPWAAAEGEAAPFDAGYHLQAEHLRVEMFRGGEVLGIEAGLKNARRLHGYRPSDAAYRAKVQRAKSPS
jgi:hypothetical protein